MSQPTPLITNSAIQAAKWLKEGQLLAYPTESVWVLVATLMTKQLFSVFWISNNVHKPKA